MAETHTVTDLSYWGMLTSRGQISIKPSSASSQNIWKFWQPWTKNYSHLPLNSFAFDKCSIFLAFIFFHRSTTQLQARCFKALTQVGCVCKQSFIGAQKHMLIPIIHMSSLVTFSLSWQSEELQQNSRAKKTKIIDYLTHDKNTY